MATYSKLKLSQSDGGIGVQVTNSSTLVHQGVSGTDDWDEIWLYAYNNSADSQTLTIQYGDNSATLQDITQTITAQSGLFLVVPGLVLQSGKAVYAITPNSQDLVTLYGYVNRITA